MRPTILLALSISVFVTGFVTQSAPVPVAQSEVTFTRDVAPILYSKCVACHRQGEVAPMPLFKATLAAPIRKAPGRTEFQRGILTPAQDGGWQVRTTGDQGSGILSSMSQANCFIVLDAGTGNVAAGEAVDVQLLEGLI